MKNTPKNTALLRDEVRKSRPAGRVVVVAEVDGDPALAARTRALAAELNLPVLPSIAASSGFLAPTTNRPEVLLVVGAERLELRMNRPGARGVYVDFIGGATGYRRRSGASRRQPFARAVGIRGDPPTVLDATTGLARDAFLLACLGCTVIAVERSAVLGRLIQDGLERARNSGLSELVEVLGRMKFIVDDSRNVLRRWRGEKPDVVYIDPMYPLEAKRSLAKKEMQICRLLVGDDTDSAELLAVARQTARKRVVVKRPRHAPPLAAEPDVQYLSKLVGYDVQYLSKLVRYDVFLTSGNGTKA